MREDNLKLLKDLFEEADRLDKKADQFKGSSWYGDVPPGTYERTQAKLLRQAALLLVNKKDSLEKIRS